ncbi:Uncharacterised protein [Moraxella lacunata]|uniref:Uncharacterized protein n=1 Tax=Moraxella lacunata TaxID=477 RepID=A0A378TTX2_MORLA|nr:Uncharacterised protein [Moraxella lacunata]
MFWFDDKYHKIAHSHVGRFFMSNHFLVLLIEYTFLESRSW